MNRIELLNAAIAATEERGAEYGPPLENHQRIGQMWAAILGMPVSPEQVALCLAAMKIARLAHNSDHQDSWKDLAGYAATGSECVDERQKANG